jgi:3-phosphoshikimate 1-carboxyvinyltransferase
MQRVIDPLSRMGGRIDSRNGLPPLTVHGGRRLSGITFELPVASAQVKSAILLAALYARGDTTIVEPAPTRDHTERMLRAMGVALESDAGHIHIAGGQSLRRADLEIPADLSSAAFFVLAALLAEDCDLVIEGVGVNPTRTGFIDVLRAMDADITLERERVLGDEPVADLRVRSSALRGTDVDPALVSLAIDEFPVLFVAAAAARGRSRFAGIGELRVKESDRIAAMADGLRTLGIRVDESPDGAVVHGGRLGGGTVDSRADHRIAMAFAIAGTSAASAVRVQHTDTVNTSFPGFADCLRSLGGKIDPAGPAPA